jgi:hypothetical protein
MNKLILVLPFLFMQLLYAHELDSTSVQTPLKFNPYVRSLAVEGSTIYILNSYGAFIDLDLLEFSSKRFSKFGVRVAVQNITKGIPYMGIDTRALLQLNEYLLRASSLYKNVRLDLYYGFCSVKTFTDKDKTDTRFYCGFDFRWIVLRPMVHLFLRVNFFNYAPIPGIGISVGYID